MLKIDRLEKVFVTGTGEVRALKGISFEVGRGEFYTLLGPSGCGKTTTLRCVAGLETPEDGTISIDDAEVYSNRQTHVPGYRRPIGMVFQSYAIWPHMTVFENVAFPLVYGTRKVPRAQVRDRVIRALSLVHLEEMAERPGPLLSGGQQQRVALARALVHEPRLLLLDEPLSNLDAKLREEMRVEIKQLVRGLGITTLYVTHDQAEALAMSDRVAVMSNGVIAQEGSPAEIYHRPANAFVADFIGKVNIFHGCLLRGVSLHRGLVDTPLGVFRCSLPPGLEVGDTVSVAVRPGGVEVSLDGPPGDDNVIVGQAESVVFVGEHLECQVRCGDRAIQVRVDSALELVPGQRVYIRLRPERCAVIKERSLAVDISKGG